jgi:hypothetical protein
MSCPSPCLRFTEEYAFTIRDAVDRNEAHIASKHET